MDFIHGHAKRFKNFSSNLKGTTPYCKFCIVSLDSPEHQLLYCHKLNCQQRIELKESLVLHYSRFNIAVILSDSNVISDRFRKAVDAIVEI